MIKIIKQLIDHFTDHFNIDADWNDFKLMSKKELKDEYDRLYNNDISGDRFRRLCQYISVHWVYDVEWNKNE